MSKELLIGNKCPKCSGSGKIITRNDRSNHEETCSACLGLGKVNIKNACPDCKGLGEQWKGHGEAVYAIDCKSCQTSGIKPDYCQHCDDRGVMTITSFDASAEAPCPYCQPAKVKNTAVK